MIRNHPLRFTEIYHRRQVNNIYFDTVGMRNFHDNIDGAAERQKYRIRWYGDLFGKAEKPVLECKIKKGQVGTKESYALNSFSVDSSFGKAALQEALAGTGFPDTLKHQLLSMQPTLLNSYTRKYYMSDNKLFRVTLDSDLQFYRIGYYGNTFLNHVKDPLSIVMELKYATEADVEASQWLDFSPLYSTKSSKYVQGINFLY